MINKNSKYFQVKSAEILKIQLKNIEDQKISIENMGSRGSVPIIS